MAIKTLTIGDPFFVVRILNDQEHYEIGDKTIFLNLSENPVQVREQSIAQFRSVVLKDTTARNINHAVVIEGYANHEDEEALMAEIRQT